MILLRNLPLGIGLTLVLGLLGPFDAWLAARGSAWAAWTYAAGIMLSLPLLLYAWALGLHLLLGRLRTPSQGAVDNGAACAVLLGLAQRLKQGAVAIDRTKVTLVLFTGEEVNMQGSRAYVRSREWPHPTIAVNLEVIGQDGEYVIWEQDGSLFERIQVPPELNEQVSAAVLAVTGRPVQPSGPLISDGGSFLMAGLPATTLGSYDRIFKDRGFHCAQDSLDRVVIERLPEVVDILSCLIQAYDRNGPGMPRTAQALQSRRSEGKES
jgi:hypothetical protein